MEVPRLEASVSRNPAASWGVLDGNGLDLALLEVLHVDVDAICR